MRRLKSLKHSNIDRHEKVGHDSTYIGVHNSSYIVITYMAFNMSPGAKKRSMKWLHKIIEWSLACSLISDLEYFSVCQLRVDLHLKEDVWKTHYTTSTKTDPPSTIPHNHITQAKAHPI